MDKQDYIGELRKRHGDSPELQELEKRYSIQRVDTTEGFSINPEISAKRATADVLSESLGIDSGVVNATYDNIVKKTYGKPMKPLEVKKQMELDGIAAWPEADDPELLTIAKSVVSGTEPPQDLMDKRYRRETVKQTAKIFSNIRQQEKDLFTGPTLWNESVLKKPNRKGVSGMPIYETDDLLDITRYKSLIEQAPTKQDVYDLTRERKRAVADLFNKSVKEQQDYFSKQMMGKFTTGNKAYDVTLESAKGLYGALNTISRGVWSASAAMGMTWNIPNIEETEAAMQKLEMTPIEASGKIGYVANTIGQAIPSFLYNMTVGGSGIFTVEYGNAYQDEKNAGQSDLKADMVALPTAAINTAIEMMQIDRIFKFAGKGKIAKDAFRKIIKEKSLSAFIKGGFKFTGESVKTAINEGVEGSLQAGVSIAMPAFVTGRYPKDKNGNID